MGRGRRTFRHSAAAASIIQFFPTSVPLNRGGDIGRIFLLLFAKLQTRKGYGRKGKGRQLSGRGEGEIGK